MIDRRTVLRGVVLGAAVAAGQVACSSASQQQFAPVGPAEGSMPRPSASAARPGSSVLLAYFSRAGENYYYGDRIDLKVGNTEALARMIRRHLDCDVHRILASDPYPPGYEETVARNTREQNADARPGISNSFASIDDYDVVLLASPIWNVRPPMIMHTFAERYDFTGKKVHPVTTHAMSGLGASERRYASACRGATIGEGLAVQGEKVRDAEDAVVEWLRRMNLIEANANGRGVA